MRSSSAELGGGGLASIIGAATPPWTASCALRRPPARKGVFTTDLAPLPIQCSALPNALQTATN